MVRLLHLSDIHFSQLDTQIQLSAEEAVRARMTEDIGQMRGDLGVMDAVLVVGDIGSRGAEADYEAAASFLDETCDLVGCARDQVVCVPGNHDVDRGAHTPVHDAIRHQLREIPAPQIADSLLALLSDDVGAQVLLAPFENYNAFAIRYGCDISSTRLVWSPKVMKLGAREIRIHGVTSPWISDETDGHGADSVRLALGLFQAVAIGANAGAVDIALCHHPSRWLRDSDQVDGWLARSHLMLTGHEHETGIALSGDSRSLHIASGAVNPDRTEDGWIPAYNVIELNVPDNGSDVLHVKTHVRTWQDRAEFGPDRERPVAEHDVVLGRSAVAPSALPTEPTPPEAQVPEPEPIESDVRTMMYRVMRAAPDRRRRIARSLGLLPEEGGPTGLEADRELLKRALADDRLHELDAELNDV